MRRRTQARARRAVRTAMPRTPGTHGVWGRRRLVRGGLDGNDATDRIRAWARVGGRMARRRAGRVGRPARGPPTPAIDDPAAGESLIPDDPATTDPATTDPATGDPVTGRPRAPAMRTVRRGRRAGQISLPAGALGGVKRRLATLRSDPAALTNTGQIPDYQVPPRAFMLIGRFAVLALVTVLGLLATGSPWIVAFAGLLAIASLPSWAAVPGRSAATVGRAAEIVITCFAAEFVVRNAHPHMFAAPGVAAGAILPYLVVPPVAAAMQRRRREAAGLLTLAAVVLTVLGLVDDQINDRGYLTESIEWVLLAAVAAAATSVLRDLLAQRRDRPQPYAEATRLLTQLRTVARQLPGATLDPGGLAEHLLDDVRTVARSDRAAVMCASGGNRPRGAGPVGRQPDRLGGRPSTPIR